MTTVVNITKAQQFDIYIGRPSKFGNPYKIGKDGTREEVIRKFRRWLNGWNPQDLRQALDELRDKRLGCFCAPLPCHGDIWKELADG